MVGDAGEHVAQVGFGVEAVELGGLDERVDRGGTLAAGVGAGEELILSAEGQRPDGALGGIVGDFEPAVGEIAGQRVPARAGVADGVGELALAGQPRQGASRNPASSSSSGGARDWRMRRRRSGGSPSAARSIANRAADAVERLLGDRRAGAACTS